MVNKEVLLTPEGLKKLEAELEELKNCETAGGRPSESVRLWSSVTSRRTRSSQDVWRKREQAFCGRQDHTHLEKLLRATPRSSTQMTMMMKPVGDSWQEDVAPQRPADPGYCGSISCRYLAGGGIRPALNDQQRVSAVGARLF